ncbi:MAG: glutathione peroxidase [Phycisphaerales bacterium]
MKCCCTKGTSATMTSVLLASLVPIWVVAISDRDEPDSAGASREVAPAEPAKHHPADVLHYEMNRIDGEPEKLETYRGKVVLLVNVASRCGLTPQYEVLEKLYKERKDEGLVILGFPANDFRGQEPGTNAEIAQFCSLEYGVTFPMFEKIEVTGEDKHPLYAQLEELPEPLGGEPKWNFTKFLVDRRGRVVERFEPRVAPDDERVIDAIDRLLAQKAPEDG